VKIPEKVITTAIMEVAIAQYFNYRTNLIVPNISWGLYIHECDLLIITPSGYAYEVEIKTNKHDLIRDQQKHHKHDCRKIKKLYFAIPECLQNYIDCIPEKAGIIIVKYNNYKWTCYKIREAQINYNYKFSDKERFQVARLGAMRIWDLKDNLNRRY